MQTRSILNITGSTTSVVMFLLLAGGFIRKVIAAFGDAQAAGDMIELVRGTNINWEIVYLYLFVLSVFTLLAVNYPEMKRTSRHRQINKQPNWDSSAIEAIRYIFEGSRYGKSFARDQRAQVAIRAFVTAARDGKIKAVGVKVGETEAKKLPKKIWRDCMLDIGSHSPRDLPNPDVVSAQLVQKGEGGKKEVVVMGIRTDSRTLEKLWPR